MSEEWRPVQGWPYEVSSCGRVRRTISAPGTTKGKLLTPWKTNNGYMQLRLYHRRRVWATTIHNLVALAFCGPKTPGVEVHHRDFDRTHNHASNLEWVTHTENQQHASRAKRFPSKKGEDHHINILTDDAVREIRRRYSRGNILQRELGVEFGVSRECISRVVLRKNWAHVLDHAVT